MSNAVALQAGWDALRTWTAERGHGTWAALRDAAVFCGLHPARAARTLAALGHLELSWDLGRWAAAPTCLVVLRQPPGRLLLTGAITTGLPSGLDARLARAGVDAAVVGPFPEGGRGPSSWQLEARPEDFAAVGEASRLPVAGDAPAAICARLPVADPELIGSAHLPDDRFPAAPIDPDTLRAAWGRPVRPGMPAVQLLPGNRPIWWVLSPDGSARRLPSGEWAAWLASAGGPPRAALDPDGTLRVDAAAPLPPLHARAALLCTGRLPGRAHSAPGVAEDRYRAVGPSVADAILASLMSTRGPVT